MSRKKSKLVSDLDIRAIVICRSLFASFYSSFILASGKLKDRKWWRLFILLGSLLAYQ